MNGTEEDDDEKNEAMGGRTTKREVPVDKERLMQKRS